MWTAPPQTFIVSVSTNCITTNSNNWIYVSVENLPDGQYATICLYKNNDVYIAPKRIVGNGGTVVALFPGIIPQSTGTMHVTVTVSQFHSIYGNYKCRY